MQEKNPQEKILLLVLPFWDPQIPPLGIACLKCFLQQHGYNVKAVDANQEIRFRDLFNHYYRVLKEIIPQNKQGNIFNIGNQVLRNHLMAHLNGKHQEKYRELVKILVKKTFFTAIDSDSIDRLAEVPDHFITALKDYVLNLLNTEKPTVLGISVFCDTFPASTAAFKWAKEWNPAVKTVMGGGIFTDQLALGSPNLEYFVHHSKNHIDKIITGEGEELLLRFLQGELKDSQRLYGLKDIQAKSLDLGSVGIPDFSDFDLNYYPHLAHYSGRSCPYQCKFCSETVIWGEYRAKDVRQTVQELVEMHRHHSCQLFLLTDSTLNPIITALAREVIHSGVALYWDGFLRADKHVSSTDNTLLWRRGGFYRAKLGLESGSQRMLDLMDKRITVEQYRETLAALAYAGIKTTTMWICGYPDETEADFQKTLDFIEQNKENIYEADCNAFYYSLTGQVNSQQWQKSGKAVRLYPQWAQKMLITETWILDNPPSRQETYQRLNRFVEHCKRLAIPNPYTLTDIYEADERWKRLHPNAVPPLVELKNRNTYVDETAAVKELTFADNKWHDEEDDWF